MSGSSGINWGSVYNTPIGQILQDLSPATFMSLVSQETTTQQSTYTSQVSQDQTQISAWTTLQSDANSVLGDLTSLASTSTYNQLSTTSSNSGVATAADQSAQQGSYNIYIQSLAQSEIDQGSTANMTVTNPNAPLTLSTGALLQGSFTVTVGGTSASVTIPTAGESLNGLAAQINNTSGMGVTATVVKNSSGDYLLELQANQTGQAISYADSGVSGGSGPLYYLGVISSDTSTTAANVLQSASSAKASFGSTFNATNYVTSSTNTFTNLIPGMTITAQSTGAATISVTPDVSSMAHSVQQFVSDWNQWVKDTQSLAAAGTVTESGSGSSATYTYQANPNQELTSALPTLALNTAEQLLGITTNGQTSSAYQSLADIGITLAANGKLSLDSSTLTQALTNDPTAVQSIFQSLSGVLGTNPTTHTTGPIANFATGVSSVAGEAVATLNGQVTKDQNAINLLKQQLTAEENQAINQYAKWINQVSSDSTQYSMLSALFNQNSSSSSGG